MNEVLFSLTEYWWVYTGFCLLIFALLALDLGVFHKSAHEVSFKEASIWSVVWVSLGLLFSAVIYWLAIVDKGVTHEVAKSLWLQYVTGFLVEKSLAVDNLFVFVMIFSWLAIPAKYQHRILFWGILGALFFRAIFIAIGASLMQYHAVVIIFGVILLISGVKMFFTSHTEPSSPEQNWVLRTLKRILPFTQKTDGDKFVTIENGKRVFTPLMLALLFLEFTDIIFAVDSVPAIFALTNEPLIVFTSNIFAILGLRSMYFLLAGAVSRFAYLHYGLAGVLIFVGLKMVWFNGIYAEKISTGWSLGLIFSMIAGSMLVSFALTRQTKGSNQPSLTKAGGA